MAKVAVITGGSGGIGAAAAVALAPDYNVVLGYNKNIEKAQRTVGEIISCGGEAVIFCADVSRSAQADAIVDFSLKQYGHVDLLVNCAGVSLRALVTETTDEQWQRIFDINVKGMFNVCRAALPHMINRKSGGIINLSSIWGMAGASCETVYSSSKAAVIGFTKALAKEVAPCGITVNCIAPGYIDTEMNSGISAEDARAFIEETPLGRAGVPEDVARAVVYLAGDTFTTGQVLCPNGGAVI